MNDFARLQAAAEDEIRFAFPNICAQIEANGEHMAAFYVRFVADFFFAAAPDGISQEYR